MKASVGEPAAVVLKQPAYRELGRKWGAAQTLPGCRCAEQFCKSYMRERIRQEVNLCIPY